MMTSPNGADDGPDGGGAVQPAELAGIDDVLAGGLDLIEAQATSPERVAAFFEAALTNRSLPIVALQPAAPDDPEVGVLATTEDDLPVVYAGGRFHRTRAEENMAAAFRLPELADEYILTPENVQRILQSVHTFYSPNHPVPAIVPERMAVARIEAADEAGRPTVKYHVFEPGRFDYDELERILDKEYRRDYQACQISEQGRWVAVDRSLGHISTHPEPGQLAPSGR